VSLPTPFPVGPVNAYLAEGEPLTLIDTGPRYRPAREALNKGLRDRDCLVVDLQRILLTHAHVDHSGLAAELAAGSGAAVCTHTANLPRLAHEGGAHRTVFYIRMMRWAGVPIRMMMKLAKVRRNLGRYSEPLTPQHTIADGDLLDLGGEDWRVLHTPGHTGGVICLYQPQRKLLISSDHLLRDISSNPIIDPPDPGERERPHRLVQYLEQLQRVAELDVALALPGHGSPITDHRSLIRKRLAFHRERALRILRLLKDGSSTAYEIACVLFPSLDPVNTFLGISEVIGHLQWLEGDGLVACEEVRGVARWMQVAR
jgi:glyoxylase-like metal-dependent hydrolase (beta-lactamase superfamily II)